MTEVNDLGHLSHHMTEDFDNRLLDHEERIASIEKTISKAEKLLILIVGLQFPNLLESLSIAGII